MVSIVTYILENDTDVQSLLGEKAIGENHKVYPVVVSQDEKAPYIAVRLVSKERIGKDCDFNYSVQVVSYANSYDEVTALNDEVIDTLEAQASGTVNGKSFGYLNFTNESDEYVNEHKLYAKVTTFEGTAE